MERKPELGERLAVLVVGVALWALHVLAAAQPIYPGKSWTQRAPEATGWAADRLKAADEVAQSIGTSAYLVVHKGVVVHAFGSIAQPMNLASVRKSVLSVLYGIAVDSWEDKQIVSSKWIRESTGSYSYAEPGVGYGYLWWVGLDHWHFQQRFPGAVFSARGNYGQFLLVDPARDLIVVHRVDMDRFLGRQVSRGAFNSLLAKVLAAAP